MDDLSIMNEPDNEQLSAGTPVLDIELYKARIEADFGDQEAAEAFLQSLWHIMCAFVDLGLDVKSSTANLPFMRDLSSRFEEAAPLLAYSKQQSEESAAQAVRKEDS